MTLVKYEPGARVRAFQSADATTVYEYGEGTYDGDHPCPALGGRLNPRITLDSGHVVWGMQCWWGPAERIEKEFVRGRKIVKVDPLDLNAIDPTGKDACDTAPEDETPPPAA